MLSAWRASKIMFFFFRCIIHFEIFRIKSVLKSWLFELEVALSINYKLEVSRRKASCDVFKALFINSRVGRLFVYTVVKVPTIFYEEGNELASPSPKTAFLHIIWNMSSNAVMRNKWKIFQLRVRQLHAKWGRDLHNLIWMFKVFLASVRFKLIFFGANWRHSTIYMLLFGFLFLFRGKKMKKYNLFIICNLSF